MAEGFSYDTARVRDFLRLPADTGGTVGNESQFVGILPPVGGHWPAGGRGRRSRVYPVMEQPRVIKESRLLWKASISVLKSI